MGLGLLIKYLYIDIPIVLLSALVLKRPPLRW